MGLGRRNPMANCALNLHLLLRVKFRFDIPAAGLGQTGVAQQQAQAPFLLYFRGGSIFRKQ